MASFTSVTRLASPVVARRRSIAAKPSRATVSRTVARAVSGGDNDDEPKLIDRDDLEGNPEYLNGFVSSGVGPDDDVQVDGRDTLTASMRLAAQTASVLTILTAGFMYSNGLGPFAR